MTLVASRASSLVIERLDPGVARIRGADGMPVMLLEDVLPDLSAEVVPLLARRHDVFRLVGGVSPQQAADALRDAFGSSALGLVGSTFAARVAPLVASLSAAVVVDAMFSDEAPLSAAVLAITGADGVVTWSGARHAIAEHPAEIAHLIDAHLRAPDRYPPGATLPRMVP